MSHVDAKVTVADIQRLKDKGEKSVCVVAWDYHLARIADSIGVDIVSVGDTVGVNMWGRDNPLDVTLDEMVLVGAAVRRGVRRALVSVDFPYGPLQEGSRAAVRAAIRLVQEAGADLVKLDAAADHPAAVEAVVEAGIPVFAQFGLTPQTAMKHGLAYSPTQRAAIPEELAAEFIAQAKRLEAAGAVMLNFTNSGPVVGPRVVEAVSIPVLGGFGGGPWLDGRIRLGMAAIGYSSTMVERPTESYANVAATAAEALREYAADVRAARPVKGSRG